MERFGRLTKATDCRRMPQCLILILPVHHKLRKQGQLQKEIPSLLCLKQQLWMKTGHGKLQRCLSRGTERRLRWCSQIGNTNKKVRVWVAGKNKYHQ